MSLLLGRVNSTGTWVSRSGLAGPGAGAALATKVGLADWGGAGVFFDASAEPIDAVGGVPVITPARTCGRLLLRLGCAAAGACPACVAGGAADAAVALAVAVTAVVG